MHFLAQRAPFGPGWSSWIIPILVMLGLLGLLVFLDPAITRAATSLPDEVTAFFAWITDLGRSEWVLVPSLVLFGICAALTKVIRKLRPKRALWVMTQLYAFLFAGVAVPGIIANLIKRLIGRARPELLDAVGSLHAQSVFNDWTHQSFPSGHTTTIFALAFVTGFLSPRWFPAALTVAVLVGLSRVVIGAHYASDVLGGMVVGTLGAYAIRNVFGSRGWLFAPDASGGYRVRGLGAVRRLLPRQRALR